MIGPTEMRGGFLLWATVRTWFAHYSPRRRLALRKRRLEALCQRHGCSRSVALAITRDFFSAEER